MSEHLNEEQLGRYRGRLMSPAELLRFGEHLAGCDECRRSVRADARLGASFSALLADLGLEDLTRGTHVSYEQLADLVDARLAGAERAVVERHLSLCAACDEEARSLSAFRDSLAAETSISARPRRRAREFAPFDRLRALFSLPRLPAARAFAALALLLTASFAAWLGWNHLRARTGESVARVEPSRPAAAAIARADDGASRVSDGGAQAATAGSTGSEVPTPLPRAGATPQDAASQRPAAYAGLVSLDDGGRRVTLSRTGELSGLSGLSPSQAGAIRDALAVGRATTPDTLAGLKGRRETLLGDDAGGDKKTFALSSPVGAVVESPRPRFTWQPVGGATRYVVEVYDQSFSKVAASGDLTQTEWAPPNDLRRGAIYSWEVTAYTHGGASRAPAPPAPEARFKVLDEIHARELARAKREAPGSHLALGVLYARAGLLDEAAHEFEILVAANPRSGVARKLLRDVRAQQQTTRR